MVVIDASVDDESAAATADATAAASAASAAASASGTSWLQLFASRADAAAYRTRAWAAQTDTARLTYDQARPGAPAAARSRSDLDKFNAQPQDVASPSPHFAVLVMLPLRVDHLTLPSTKPDPRRPAHIESVLQPSKTGSRWQHERASVAADAAWRTTELNP